MHRLWMGNQLWMKVVNVKGKLVLEAHALCELFLMLQSRISYSMQCLRTKKDIRKLYAICFWVFNISFHLLINLKCFPVTIQSQTWEKTCTTIKRTPFVNIRGYIFSDLLISIHLNLFPDNSEEISSKWATHPESTTHSR